VTEELLEAIEEYIESVIYNYKEGTGNDIASEAILYAMDAFFLASEERDKLEECLKGLVTSVSEEGDCFCPTNPADDEICPLCRAKIYLEEIERGDDEGEDD
jgi:hypothetical protein